MKIEKVNDNQIRCTLTKSDLADRQIKLSELAYGTDKAKALFRDMMQQAATEFGFEAEDIPLMIEAIPLSADCIILIITKVEYPEELDTRFSKFAPSAYEDSDDDYGQMPDTMEGADAIIDLFRKLSETLQNTDDKKDFVPLPNALNKSKKTLKNTNSGDTTLPSDLEFTRLYSFKNLDNAIRVASVLNDFYFGKNSLYKDNKNDIYYLTLSKSKHTPEEFNKVCNIISEYSNSEKYTAATRAYLSEHLETIISDNALQLLASI